MRAEKVAPPGSMRYPALAAIALASAIVGSIWWRTREVEPVEPLAVLGTVLAEKAPATGTPRKLTDQVQAFVAFAGQDVPGESPHARAATAHGMQLLAAAMAARGDSVLWRDRAMRLEEAAARVANAADSTVAAVEAQEALVQAASWVAGLPRVKSKPEPLAAPASSIDPDKPLRDQTEKVEAFFGAAARALGGDQA